MPAWPDRRVLDLFGIDVPIVLAPMAGPGTPELAIAVSNAGGLGSLPCALLSIDRVREAVQQIRAAAPGPLNLNFFCHVPPAFDEARESAWRARLAPYYREQRLDPGSAAPRPMRKPFDAELGGLVERCRPEVVSFHFGLPEPALLERVKATGATVVSSATTVNEARWLEAHGCDAIVAQGFEAGGHRGMFLSEDVGRQVGTFALVPQVADAVSVPVIAAGAVADARGIVAALALGASAVQIGTAYLFCPEAKVPVAHREALDSAADDDTMVTNVFTGRPARGIVNRLMREVGPMSPDVPPFPFAAGALAPLAAQAGVEHSRDFVPLWSGQAARLATPQGAGELTRRLAAEALERIGSR